jgi:hypothetical protein
MKAFVALLTQNKTGVNEGPPDSSYAEGYKWWTGDCAGIERAFKDAE